MRKTILVLIFFVGMILSFQNCGDINLEREMRLEDSILSLNNPQGTICPGKSAATGQDIKFLFVVDMSLSNIGKLNNIANTLYLDTSVAVDLNGQRFTAINNFIDTCGGGSASYSVIGFADTAIFGQSSSGHIRDCNSGFVDSKNLAKSFVNDLRQVQNTDKGRGPVPAGFNNPYIMGMTSYREALRCVDTNIKVDLSLNPASTAHYQVFFITDGDPNESFLNQNVFCEGDPACIQMFLPCNSFAINTPEHRACMHQVFINDYYPSQVASTSQRVRMANTSFDFLPLYYGFDDEYLSAKEILDKLAKIDNPDGETIRVDDISSISDTLCDSLESQTSVPYIPSEPYVINLTAKEINGNWYADSDMDGLADIEELELGFNPLNARTNGVLDSICINYFGGQCPTIPNSCRNNHLGLFLNECEKDIIPGSNLNGLDTDKDGLLDFIEIIKGTNPSISDLSGQNFDGDLKTNYQEVVLGTNPRSQTPFHLIKRYIEVDLLPANNQYCDSNLNGYSFEITNFPFAKNVLEYEDPSSPGPWNLSHSAGENVFLIYYIARPVSFDPNLKNRIYATIIRAKENQAQIYLTQNNFIMIGEIQQ